MCPGCMAEREKKREQRYNKYFREKTFNFIKYFNEQFNYHFTDPSVQAPDEIKIRKEDKFYHLKKSNSQEELKKNYFKLAKQYHPDKKTGSTQLFQKLSEIYELLLRQFI
tara:strand:- start:991 stop:1320 length:330 start_codon:yes stop_codon:yes gene_type:complete